MSPPLPDSSPPVSVTVMVPSFTAQPVVGKPPPRALRQPSLVLPSKSSRQPSAFSFGVSVFGFCAKARETARDTLRATRAYAFFIRNSIAAFHCRMSILRQTTWEFKAAASRRSSDTMFEIFPRVGPDNSLERLTERSVGLITDQPGDVDELLVPLLE